ncbi:MAG TPA: hypothetical protein VHE81_15800 [Lacipirellulaceae bacterium]|nr:hypothetical protein [Lacipirellulaceae bacterium]
MAEERKQRSGYDGTLNPDGRVVAERIQELTWDLFDEQISDDEFRLLENLLLSDATARQSYLACVQLQADLMSHFGSRTVAAGSSIGTKSTELGFLNTELPSIVIESPSTDQAAS